MEIIVQIKNLGDAIKYKRAALSLSQRQLAKKVGVDYTYISKIENNIVMPSALLIRDLEAILRFPEGELLRFAGLPSGKALDLLANCIREYGYEKVESLLNNLLEKKGAI